MKLGTGADAVNAITFGVKLGLGSPAYAYEDTVKLLTMIDGTQEFVNFGARVKREATLVLGDMAKADYFVLIAYLTANRGNVIKFTTDFAAENPWGQAALLSSSVFYANLVDFDDQGEADFSILHSLYSVRLNIVYTGTGSSSRPNATDTSLLDLCVEIDTVRATSTPANAAALAALTGMVGGQRYLQVDTRAVYIFDPSGTTFIDFNDGGNQLSGFFRLKGVVKGTNTDADGKLYINIVDDGGGFRHINIYKNSARTQLVAHTATYNTTGRKAIIEDNSSGFISSGSITVDAVGAADSDIQLGMYRFLYTLTADSTTYGLVNGVFYLSAFADISSGSTGAESKTWKSGLINRESIRFPNAQIDISRGPGIERLEGFSFAMSNVAKFWTYVVDNRVLFHGAKIKLKIYDRTNGVMVTIRTGVNHNNSFDYTDYRFQVEPTILSENKAFPDTYLTPAAYPYSDSSVQGKPVITTYGRWQAGILQVANFTLKSQRFSNGRRFLGFNAWNGGTSELRVDLDYDYFTELLGTTTYPGTNPTRYLYVQITEQDDQPDVGKMKRITAITDVSANVTGLTLAEAFTVAPDASALIQIYMSSVMLLADDEAMIGFGAPGYLVDSQTGGTTIPKQLFAKIGDAVEEVPDGVYQEVGTNKNALTVNVDSLEADDSGKITVKGAEVLNRVTVGLAGILFASTTNCIHDFEFSPKGAYTGYAIDAGAGRVRLVASYDRITVGWRPITATEFTSIKIVRAYADNNNRLINDTTFSKTLAGLGQSYYVDTGADGALVSTRRYNYTIVGVRADGTMLNWDFATNPVSVGGGSGGLVPLGTPALGSTGSANQRSPELRVSVGDGTVYEAILIWNRQPTQVEVKIYRNDVVSGDVLVATVTSTTQTYYALAVGAVNALDEGYRIQVATSAIGDNSKTWFKPDNVIDQYSDIFQLVTVGGPYSSAEYNVGLAWLSTGSKEKGYRIKTFSVDDAAGLPAAAVVMTWPLRLDRSQLPNLANATEVRLLGDFVVGSYTGTDLAASDIPVLIQLRGVRRDRTSIVLAQYTSSDAGLETIVLTRGAFAKFVNLPASRGGADSNYSTEQQTTNASATYTGKDMWRIPDWVFADDAFEWNQLEYLMFCVTNAEAIATAASSASPGGYNLGFGGIPGQSQAFTNVHKTTFVLEYVRKFEGGLTAPQFARIDGGITDDASGTITGTATAMIEKVRDISDSILTKLLGYPAKYAGSEMASRRLWLGHYQQIESRDLQTQLAVLAKNNWACFTVASDDTLYLRTLDVDEAGVAAVFAFTASNIIKGSVSPVVFRKQSEIYQKVKSKYNFDPRVQFSKAEQEGDRRQVDNPSYTAEMIVGWDAVQGKKITGGFGRIIEDDTTEETEMFDLGDEGRLVEYCRQSLLLYATGSQANELGAEKNELFEMFYRPTKPSQRTGHLVELTLPNQDTLYGTTIKSPKRAMQELFDKFVRFNVFDAWTFSFDVNMKHLIYNVSVAGKLDEAGTAERRLKLLDKVTVTLPFHSNSVTMDCLIIGVQLNGYAGTARLTVFALRPPGQRNTIIDHVWDAGYGSRTNSDYQFKDESYGLSPAPNAGTYADAGNGARTNSDYDFPDGTFADSDGEGTGQI